jgi:hypothetical protein
LPLELFDPGFDKAMESGGERNLCYLARWTLHPTSFRAVTSDLSRCSNQKHFSLRITLVSSTSDSTDTNACAARVASR